MIARRRRPPRHRSPSCAWASWRRSGRCSPRRSGRRSASRRVSPLSVSSASPGRSCPGPCTVLLRRSGSGRDGGRRADPADDRAARGASTPGCGNRRLRRRAHHRRRRSRPRSSCRSPTASAAGAAFAAISAAAAPSRSSRGSWLLAPHDGHARLAPSEAGAPLAPAVGWLIGARLRARSRPCSTARSRGSRAIYVERGWTAATRRASSRPSRVGIVATLAAPLFADRFGTRRSQIGSPP